jgi:hypothetical protein
MGTGYRIFEDDNYGDRITGGHKDTVVQIILSTAIGLVAFLGFCVRSDCVLRCLCIMLIFYVIAAASQMANIVQCEEATKV